MDRHNGSEGDSCDRLDSNFGPHHPSATGRVPLDWFARHHDPGLWAGGSAPQKTMTHVALAAATDDVIATPRALQLAGITALDFEGHPTAEPFVLAWMPAASIFLAIPMGTCWSASTPRKRVARRNSYFSSEAAGIFVSRAGISDVEGERHVQIEERVREWCATVACCAVAAATTGIHASGHGRTLVVTMTNDQDSNQIKVYDAESHVSASDAVHARQGRRRGQRARNQAARRQTRGRRQQRIQQRCAVPARRGRAEVRQGRVRRPARR